VLSSLQQAGDGRRGAVLLSELACLLPDGLTVEETTHLIDTLEERGLKVAGGAHAPAGRVGRRPGDHPPLSRQEEVLLARQIRAGQRRRLEIALRWPGTAHEILRRADQIRSGVCRVWDVLADFEGSHPDEDEDQAAREFSNVASGLKELDRKLMRLRSRLETRRNQQKRGRGADHRLPERLVPREPVPAGEVSELQSRLTEQLGRLDFREGTFESILKKALQLACRLEAGLKDLAALERLHGLAAGSLSGPEGLPRGWEREVRRAWGVPAGEAEAVRARVKARRRVVDSALHKARLPFDELRALGDALREASRQTDRARQTLVEANQRLVIGIARRYPHHHLDFVDLVQEGNLGLMRAADRFNPDLGFRFGTYAAWWVRQSIGRLLAEQGGAVRIPPHVQESLQKINRITRRLVLRTGREPSIEELAAHLDKTPERVKEILTAGRRPVSTDAHVGDEDDSATLLDFLPDPRTGPDEEADQRVQQAVLQDAMSALSPREREIISQRFQEGLTLQEVGDRFKITRERTRQLQEQALGKLRKRLKADLLRRLVRDERHQRTSPEPGDPPRGRTAPPRGAAGRRG
jgi:RNA polymerase primary sigma factor